jgi:hypothetical protein
MGSKAAAASLGGKRTLATRAPVREPTSSNEHNDGENGSRKNIIAPNSRVGITIPQRVKQH